MAVSADWIPFGGADGEPIYYRKRTVYDMEWRTVQLDAVIMAVSRDGGPIATVRDPRKLVRIDGEGTRAVLRIFSSAGAELAVEPWDRGVVIGMGWTGDEKLIVVSEDGRCHMFSVLGEFIKSFGVGMSSELDVAQQVSVYDTGVVLLTKNNQLYLVNGLEDCRPQQLADPALYEKPFCMEVMPPEFTYSTVTEVLLSPRFIESPEDTEDPIEQDITEDGIGKRSRTIIVIDANSAVDQNLNLTSSYLKMALSPNGQLLACYTAEGRMCVITSDLTKNLTEFNTQSRIAPSQLVWCGGDAVVMSWNPEVLQSQTALVLVVNPAGDCENFIYDGPVYLVSEIDGVRIISQEKCEFLEKVPTSTVDIFKIGSLEPCALLHDAYIEYKNKNSNCIRNVRGIGDSLVGAVEKCVEAAGNEFDMDLQKTLLNAASFGKAFLEKHSPEKFVRVCKVLRVLNAVRSWQVGMPLTFSQYERLSAPVLVDRLVYRNKHLLALRVSQHLDLRVDKVLVHWACRKVTQNIGDDDVLAAIMDKLNEFKAQQLPFHLIARTAHASERKSLAIRLLDYESSASEQVPILIEMNEFSRALEKAVISGDSDLIYFALFQIRDIESRAMFSKYLREAKPVVRNLFVKYAVSHSTELLYELLYEMDSTHEISFSKIRDAFVTTAAAPELSNLLSPIGDEIVRGGRKEYQPIVKLLEGEIQLLNVQLELESVTSKSFQLLPLADTLYQAIVSNEVKRADKLRTVFKVSDKKYWWIKIRALASSRNYDTLERFSKEKKSPIGYVPFVRVCLDNANAYEAEKYIPRINDLNQRAELLIEMDRLEAAANTAFQAKNVGILERIGENSGGSRRLELHVQGLLKQLAEGK